MAWNIEVSIVILRFDLIGIILQNLTPHWYHVTEFDTPVFFTKKLQRQLVKIKTWACPGYRADQLFKKKSDRLKPDKPVTRCLQYRLIVRYQLNGYWIHLEFMDFAEKTGSTPTDALPPTGWKIMIWWCQW